MPRYPWFAALASLLLVSRVLAHSGHAPGDDMAAAASSWLQALDDTQRKQATYALDDAERENWHFIPKARNGLPLKAMTPAQRELARTLVATALSERGRLTTEAIMALEDVLFTMEGADRRDRGLYYFTVFGTPASHGTWGWRLEGHHMSVNFLVVDGTKVSATPMFFGSNPAEVRIEHAQKGKRALAAEEDLGRALVQSLDAGQQKAVLIDAKAPSDIITGNSRQVQLAEPAGVSYAQLTADQQARLRALVELYATRLRSELAQAELQKIAAQGWENLRFAWAGSLEPNRPHYYRIQGPRFVIEYDNTQNNSNHIHTTWRDLTGDFGRDLLKEHYEQAHPAK